MHDLVNDLAQWAAGDVCYRLDGKLNANNQSKIPTKVRYFSYIPYFCDGIKRFEDFTKACHYGPSCHYQKGKFATYQIMSLIICCHN